MIFTTKNQVQDYVNFVFQTIKISLKNNDKGHISLSS